MYINLDELIIALRNENEHFSFQGSYFYANALADKIEDMQRQNELLHRLVSAVSSSEFGGITCFDIDGHGNWFDVRDQFRKNNK